MINHHIISLTRGRSGRMSKRGLALPAAAILVAAVAAAAPAGAAAQYPSRLVDPGTFGGPQSFLNQPTVPLTTQGARRVVHLCNRRPESAPKAPEPFATGPGLTSPAAASGRGQLSVGAG